jgi:hypothetical protein
VDNFIFLKDEDDGSVSDGDVARGGVVSNKNYMPDTEPANNGAAGASADPGSEWMPVTACETKLAIAQKVIANLREEIANLERLLASDAENVSVDDLIIRKEEDGQEMIGPAADGKIVEGVFDGQHMIGADGKQYLVPPNYASKSKLVEGDILKLTIAPNGTFLFKQIGPIERKRVMGMLLRDDHTGDWKVAAESKKFNILTASVTFFKGSPGDDAVVLIPKSAPSKWAAVENIIRKE